MPTDAPKRPSVTLRASHKQPSASHLSYHRQGPHKWRPSKHSSSRLARLDKPHKAPQKLVAKHIINWLPSTLHTSSTTGKIRFIRTFLFGHLCFDVAQTKERSHVATKSRLRAIQPNHLCHGSLAFLHDNVITFNVFNIVYANHNKATRKSNNSKKRAIHKTELELA